MKPRILGTCAVCGRGNYDNRRVEVKRDGVTMHDLTVCQPCASRIDDAVTEAMRAKAAA